MKTKKIKINPNNRMLKINLFMSKYLLYAFPIIIITVVWNLLTHPNTPNTLVYNILGCYFMLWFVLLIYFFITLVVSPAFINFSLPQVKSIFL